MQKVSVFGTKRPRFLLDLAEELYFNKGSRLLSCPLRHHESGGDENGVLMLLCLPVAFLQPLLERISGYNQHKNMLDSDFSPAYDPFSEKG